jgi:hypothetical protein
VEPWLQAGKYTCALMSQIPSRNGWTIAEHAGDRAPDKTQRLLLAATLFAHELAGFDVHVPAGLGGDLLLPALAGVGGGVLCGGVCDRWRGACAGARSGWAVAGVIESFEEAGERADRFEQQSVEAGLLVGGVAGAELGDRAAVAGLGGELAEPGGDRGAHVGRRRGVVSRG